jgi:hypothetical protein
MRDIEQWLDPSFSLDRSVMEDGCRSWLRVALLHRGKRIGIASMAARASAVSIPTNTRTPDRVAEPVAVSPVHELLATTPFLDQRASWRIVGGRYRTLGSPCGSAN